MWVCSCCFNVIIEISFSMHCAHMVTFCNGTVMMSSMYAEFQPTIRYTSLSKRLSFYHSIANINMISMNYNRIVYARNPFQSNWLQCVRCLVPAIVKRLIAFPMNMFEIISFGMTNFSKINFVWPFDFWPFDFWPFDFRPFDFWPFQWSITLDKIRSTKRQCLCVTHALDMHH